MEDELSMVYLPVEWLVPNEANPNEMGEREFNALCEAIEEEGFIDPVQVVQIDPAETDGEHRYQIVGGHHRWEAAKIVGLEKMPCVLLDPEKFDEDRQAWNLVKLNIVRGKMNPEKFTELYDRMVKTYGAEVLQTLMGFTTEDAFQKLYKGVKESLPKELQDALENVKDEIRTIDDLSLVLNRLFREYGETLPSNMMVFSWAGKEVMWIRCSTEAWAAARTMVDMAESNGKTVDDQFRELVERSGDRDGR